MYLPKILDIEIYFIKFVVDETKKRWKNIRDSYSRNKRKPGTGSAGSSKKKWSLAIHLTFLDQVEYEREYVLKLELPIFLIKKNGYSYL